MMSLLFLILTIFSLHLSSSGNRIIDHGGVKPKLTCTNTEGKIVSSGDVWTEGCLVNTCNNGKVETELADICVQLIEKQVSIIVEKKLDEKCKKEVLVKEPVPFKLKTSGIIAAGGDNQKQVKLFKPDTKEFCDLPDLPDFFCSSSLNLINGTLVTCGSCEDNGSQRSCIQLSPASEVAEWTSYLEDIPEHQVSLVTPEEIILMGGSGDSIGVSVLSPDGTSQWSTFFLKRYIDGACGIEDGDSLIITGGSWINSKGETVATKTVDRYNSKGFVEDLPEMNVARRSHGCGYLYQDGKKVLVVAGGYQSRGNVAVDEDKFAMFITERLILGENGWKIVAPLPQPMYGFASASLNDKIYLIVGDISSSEVSIIEYDGKEWDETLQDSYMNIITSWSPNSHGNRAIAVDLQISGFDEFCH